MKIYKGLISKLPKNGIAVIGTNWEGKHLAGAAKWALINAGAKMGQAMGLMGRTWGIVTKDLEKDEHPSIPSEIIIAQILTMYEYARNHPKYDFYVFYSASGANLNGYSNEDMAHMFGVTKLIPENIVFEEGFSKMVRKYYEEI